MGGLGLEDAQNGANISAAIMDLDWVPKFQ
jgi:hypothetical protein